MEIYRGSYRTQSGRGMLGNLFGVFRRVLLTTIKRTAIPLLKRGAKKMAPKLLKAGVGILSDVGSKKKSFKEAARSRGVELLNSATIKQRPPKRPAQRRLNARGGKRPRTTRKDIFG